jgi:alkylated DNA repair dioxygenase AlkB
VYDTAPPPDRDVAPVQSQRLAWQPSLLTGARPEVDGSFGSLVRVQLDTSSWVDHAPGWLAGPDQLFADLLAAIPWRQRRRRMFGAMVDEPRLTHWMAGTAAGGAPPWPDLVETARLLLSARYGVGFDSVGFNLYRDGRDSVAWHRDTIPAEITDPVVALLSLGDSRRLLLRPRGGGASRAFALGPGDLLVTGGRTQRQWEHTVPKVATAGPRISLAFRHGVDRSARRD